MIKGKTITVPSLALYPEFIGIPDSAGMIQWVRVNEALKKPENAQTPARFLREAAESGTSDSRDKVKLKRRLVKRLLKLEKATIRLLSGEPAPGETLEDLKKRCATLDVDMEEHRLLLERALDYMKTRSNQEYMLDLIDETLDAVEKAAEVEFEKP